jgi:hypothetical protein
MVAPSAEPVVKPLTPLQVDTAIGEYSSQIPSGIHIPQSSPSLAHYCLLGIGGYKFHDTRLGIDTSLFDLTQLLFRHGLECGR